MIAPSIFDSSYSSCGVNGWSSRIPPEKRNSSLDGSPITISAPSCERMMSSIAIRSSVPGAIRAIASSSFGSLRGSSSAGARENPSGAPARSGLVCLCSVCIQSGGDGAAEGLHLHHRNLAMRLRAGRNERGREPELRALLEAALLLRGDAQAAGEADLAESCGAGADGDAAGSARDRQGDGQVGAGLVDTDAACDVHEYVGLPGRDARVAAEHGDDHREPLRIDAGADPARHREVGLRDERLDLEQDRPRPLERARNGRADLAVDGAAEE